MPKGTASADPITVYLCRIGKIPLLTHVQALDLTRQVQAWLTAENPSPTVVATGHRAKQKMIEANLRLVVVIAKKYKSPGMEFLDLVQEGTLGLAHAVDKFAPTKGYAFSTYAYWWIRQGITRVMSSTVAPSVCPCTSPQSSPSCAL